MDKIKMSIIYLVVAIAIWGIVHSLLASIPVKDIFRRMGGAGLMRLYRLGYNIFSVLSFLPILYLMMVLPDRSLYSVLAPWSFLMLAGQGLAALLLIVGVLQTDTLSFVGLRQFFEEDKSDQLVVHGLYRYVRHPLYTFGLLFIWLSPTVTLNSLTVYIAATVYTLVGAFFEERKLLREFGQSYANYQRVTPMLIPGLVFHRNK
jgi:protein-S-isoprenylcysteine O-methyltransferase Ste14